MNLPKFLLADNSSLQEDIFVLHTEFPRFIINIVTDEVEWFDHLDGEEKELLTEISTLIDAAGKFYEEEIEIYSKS